MVLDAILDTALKNASSISWSLTGKLHDLDYADDICIMSNSHHDVQYMLDNINQKAVKAGLKINGNKTKSMRLNTTCILPIRLDNGIVEEVSEFCYLGSILTSDSSNNLDINSRIAKARQAYGILTKIWRSNAISLKTKIQIFNTNVKSVLLYGCETWNNSRASINRLQVFVNKCLRSILKIFWPNTLTNTELWIKANQQPIETQIKARKWNWIGHVLRRPRDNIARSALDWNPQGSCRQGRPANTWRRTILNELNKIDLSWNQTKRIAVNRVRWRSIVDALCST
jgi:hypothetical protein